MTWEELKEKAKELGYIDSTFCLRKKDSPIHFWKNGGRISYDYPDDSFADIAYNRTPEQMLMIMEALK